MRIFANDEALKLTWRTLGALKRVDERFASLLPFPHFWLLEQSTSTAASNMWI
jgi:hypothetical protein